MIKKKIKKRFDFSYFHLIRKLVATGRYVLTTENVKGEPLITTTFYADGDALNCVYLKNEEYLAEDYPAELEQHQDQLRRKIGTMDIFSEHITWFVGILSLLVSFTVHPGGSIWTQIGVSGGFVAIALLLKKYILLAMVFVIRFVIKIFIGNKVNVFKRNI